MKKKAILILMILLAATLAAQETRSDQLSKTDWMHLAYPGMGYLIGEQTLQAAGCTQGTAESVTLAAGITIVIAKEYRDSRCGGVSCQKDIELGIISLVASYYINKGINALIRGK